MSKAILFTLAMAVNAIGAPPTQESVSVVLGPKAYRDGDVIEITEVTATSQNLEQGDSVTVRGRVRLDSRDSAQLCLFVTQTEGDGREETDRGQVTAVDRGIKDFELRTTIKHRGALHVTFYDLQTGKPFGGVYFGTKQQMARISDWSVQHYLGE